MKVLEIMMECSFVENWIKAEDLLAEPNYSKHLYRYIHIGEKEYMFVNAEKLENEKIRVWYVKHGESLFIDMDKQEMMEIADIIE